MNLIAIVELALIESNALSKEQVSQLASSERLRLKRNRLLVGRMDFLGEGQEINSLERKIALAKYFVNRIKELSGCSTCSETHVACIDFHHFGIKRNSIAVLVGKGRPLKSIVEEIKKCIPVCSNCHRKEHSKILEVSERRGTEIPSL